MGWTLSSDMNGQVPSSPSTLREEAVAYAQRHGIAFEVLNPKEHSRVAKTYADNFAFTRREPWTH